MANGIAAIEGKNNGTKYTITRITVTKLKKDEQRNNIICEVANNKKPSEY